MKLPLLLLLALLLVPAWSSASSPGDSLKLFQNLQQAKSITQKIECNIQLAEYFEQKNIDKAMYHASEALKLATKQTDENVLAKSYSSRGEVNFLSGNFDSARVDFNNALKRFQKSNNKIGIGDAYAGLGKIAYKVGENDLALKDLSEALDIYEREKHKDALPGLYINFGLLYDDAENYDQAIEFYNKALVIAQEIGDVTAEASAYTNLGSVYTLQKKYKEAIEALETSIVIKNKAGNKKGKAVSLNNLGAVYYEMKDNDKALDCFEQAYHIYEEINDPKGIFPSCNNIGSIYIDEKRFVKAIPYLNRALVIAEQLNSLPKQIVCLENLTFAHKGLGNYTKAVDYGIKCWSLKDTLYDHDQAEITAEMQTKFASEKKQQENEILNLKVESESFQKMIFIIAAGLLFVLAFFILRGLMQKHKINKALEEKNTIIEDQKKTVEFQKHLVEEQHKDIKDSIRYAERIQKAILPPDKVWFDVLPDSFVFYKPKDILSGDFYWIEKKNDLVFVAAADCTGHGVPGALISIVNYNLLNKATLEKDLSDPAEILDYVNLSLSEALHQTYKESSVKDGMDISLCVINTRTLEMNYAGANNPVYVLRDNEIIQLKADKFPVGAFVDEKIQKFSKTTFALQKNDLLYLFSDGFADQFGGPKGKKFKYQQLKDLLLTNKDLAPEQQRVALEKAFIDWKGDLQQIDDVCVIGIRI